MKRKIPFERPDSFTLGVCNGCQMVAQPGARVANVETLISPSLFFQDMEGSLLPIPVAHGDGRATIMMPHPERCFRRVQMSENDGSFKGENGPWMRMFENAFSSVNSFL